MVIIDANRCVPLFLHFFFVIFCGVFIFGVFTQVEFWFDAFVAQVRDGRPAAGAGQVGVVYNMHSL